MRKFQELLRLRAADFSHVVTNARARISSALALVLRVAETLAPQQVLRLGQFPNAAATLRN